MRNDRASLRQDSSRLALSPESTREGTRRQSEPRREHDVIHSARFTLVSDRSIRNPPRQNRVYYSVSPKRRRSQLSMKPSLQKFPGTHPNPSPHRSARAHQQAITLVAATIWTATRGQPLFRLDFLINWNCFPPTLMPASVPSWGSKDSSSRSPPRHCLPPIRCRRNRPPATK